MNYPMVLIKARDWNLYDGQYNPCHKFHFAVCMCVGWMLKEDEEKVIIAREYDDITDEVRGVSVIPKENILKIKELEIVS